MNTYTLNPGTVKVPSPKDPRDLTIGKRPLTPEQEMKRDLKRLAHREVMATLRKAQIGVEINQDLVTLARAFFVRRHERSPKGSL